MYKYNIKSLTNKDQKIITKFHVKNTHYAMK